MNTALSLFILIPAIVLYGYLMPRFTSRRYYTFINLAFAAATVIFAKSIGVSWQNLALGFNNLGSLIAAILLLSLIVSTYLLLRFKKTSSSQDYTELMLRIPFGTALSEELIFRSSLMGVLLQSYSRLAAIISSSVVFAFWHLLPGPNSIWAQKNIKFKSSPKWLAQTSSGSLTLLVTFIGGLFFGWLRLIGNSLLLPWFAHASINIAGLTISSMPKLKFIKEARP